MEDVNGKNKVEKKKILNELIKVFWVFIIGSIIGYIVEMIVGILQNGHLVSRQGLLIGPFIQVYGIGLVSYYLVISRTKNMSNVKIFIISMILGGVVEYLFSYFQEKLFGTISWDYSYLQIFHAAGSLLSQDGILIAECDKKKKPDVLLELGKVNTLGLFREKNYGRCCLLFIKLN